MFIKCCGEIWPFNISVPDTINAVDCTRKPIDWCSQLAIQNDAIVSTGGLKVQVISAPVSILLTQHNVNSVQLVLTEQMLC